MIKDKQAFFWTCNSRGYGFHGNKGTILYLISIYYSLSVLSVKLYFLEIDPVYQKLWSFKCTMLKTLYSQIFLSEKLRHDDKMAKTNADKAQLFTEFVERHWGRQVWFESLRRSQPIYWGYPWVFLPSRRPRRLQIWRRKWSWACRTCWRPKTHPQAPTTYIMRYLKSVPY